MSRIIPVHGQNLPERDLYHELAAQIRKDFVSCGAEVDFPPNHDKDTYATLAEYLSPVITDLLRTDRNKMMKVIYRVDIPENQLGRALENVAATEAAQVLTDLVIAREKKKIEMRHANR